MSDLGSRLRSVPVPGEDAARARTAATLADAFATRRRPRARARRRLTPVAGVLAALSVTAAALAASGQGGAVTRWLGELVDPPPAARPLHRLPAPGRLLAVSAGGAWLIDADGDRHRLGDFADATWSPHGLFVAGVHGNELAAVDPEGEVHWTLTAAAAVHDPRWGPDGFRIAYRAGRSLRVVAGDGSGDRLIAPAVAPLPAAWQPGRRHALAFLTASGTLRLAAADAGTSRRIAGGLRDGLWLGWSGGRLLAATPRRLLAPAAHRAWRAPTGAAIAGAAVAPGGGRVAVLLRGGGMSRLLLIDARTLRQVRTLTTVAGGVGPPVWSPDGRWLAAAQPGRGRWLMVPVARQGRPRALSGLGAALGGPDNQARPRGWCCP